MGNNQRRTLTLLMIAVCRQLMIIAVDGCVFQPVCRTRQPAAFSLCKHTHPDLHDHTERPSIQHMRLAFYSNCVPILHRFSDIAIYCSKVAKLSYHTCVWRPSWGDSVQILPRSLAPKTKFPRLTVLFSLSLICSK